jgi:hypothetical protein
MSINGTKKSIKYSIPNLEWSGGGVVLSNKKEIFYLMNSIRFIEFSSHSFVKERVE